MPSTVLGSLLVLNGVSLNKTKHGRGNCRASPSCLWRRRACRELSTEFAGCLVAGGGVRICQQCSSGELTRAMAGEPYSLPKQVDQGVRVLRDGDQQCFP